MKTVQGINCTLTNFPEGHACIWPHTSEYNEAQRTQLLPMIAQALGGRVVGSVVKLDRHIKDDEAPANSQQEAAV